MSLSVTGLLLAALLDLSTPALAAPAAPDAASSFEAIHEPPARAPLTDEATIDAETHRIARLLRCPVCQGMSVADSREGLSLAMKDRIRELVTDGYTQDQIIDYFVLRYGESIVLLPDTRHRLVWLAPLAALLGGLTWVGLRYRSGISAPAPAPATAAAVPGADDDDYRRRVLAELEEG